MVKITLSINYALTLIAPVFWNMKEGIIISWVYTLSYKSYFNQGCMIGFSTLSLCPREAKFEHKPFLTSFILRRVFALDKSNYLTRTGSVSAVTAQFEATKETNQ